MVENGMFGQPTFTLSWILTWYSHDIDNFIQVQRVFDACLAQHPLYVVYMSVATILLNKNKLIEEYDEDDPQTSLYVVFQDIGPKSKNFEVESVIQMANELIE